MPAWLVLPASWTDVVDVIDEVLSVTPLDCGVVWPRASRGRPPCIERAARAGEAEEGAELFIAVLAHVWNERAAVSSSAPAASRSSSWDSRSSKSSSTADALIEIGAGAREEEDRVPRRPPAARGNGQAAVSVRKPPRPWCGQFAVHPRPNTRDAAA